MNGKQLKNSILQWAIQGKLVPQDPNDEPASELLKRIREEKARLVKEGKIKKDKNESIIFRGDDNSHYEKLADGEVRCIDSELPFEIPSSWEWCRIFQIGSSQLGKTLDRGKEQGDEYPYLCSINVYWDGVDLSKVKTFKLQDNELERYKVCKGDLLICEGGDYGRCAVWDREDEMYYQNALHRVRFFYNISPYFYKYVIELYRNIGYIVGQGQTIKHFTYENMKSLLFPLPPLNEQQNVVKKIDSVLSLTKNYTVSQNALEKLNDEIFIRLKQSILQEAIQGHLVSQDPAEEPAEELLKRIHKEKERLVTEGKLKRKDVVESNIFKGEDNKYYEQINGSAVEIAADFDFPSTWKIVRLADVCRLTDGEKKQGKHICLDAKYLRGKSSGDFMDKGKFVTTGDNIILVDGENSGEVFTIPCDGYMGSTFKQLWVSAEMHLPFVLYFIQFYKDHLRNSKKGAAIPHLNKDIFYNLLIGVPPITEQMRISSKIEELYSKL